MEAALGSALKGIHEGMKTVADNAELVSNFTSRLENGLDVVSPMIGIKQGIRQVEANRKVVNAVDRLTGELLDIIA